MPSQPPQTGLCPLVCVSVEVFDTLEQFSTWLQATALMPRSIPARLLPEPGQPTRAPERTSADFMLGAESPSDASAAYQTGMRERLAK